MTQPQLRNASARELTIVQCGARGFRADPSLARTFPRIRYIGFEPDAAECARLNATARAGESFHPVAIAGNAGARTLYVTKNPECSSLLKPDREFFGQFAGGAQAFEVVATPRIDVVDLDSYLGKIGAESVDVLLLDVQGAELEILEGGRNILRSVLSVTTEVEFGPVYENQPLFGAVDEMLRANGFLLFDLSRSRYRRAGVSRHVSVRGQLLSGNAVYLRDVHQMSGDADAGSLVKLALIASASGFADYTYEVANVALSRSSEIDPADIAELRRFTKACIEGESPWSRVTSAALQSRFGRLYARGIRLLARANTAVLQQRQINWED